VAETDLCRHNNYYRHITQGDRELLSEIVFRTFKSRFQEPTMDEGYQEIKKINFVFDGDDTDLDAWRKWYL
jgi:bifunctional polynucleotide phosphatase/kinase